MSGTVASAAVSLIYTPSSLAAEPLVHEIDVKSFKFVPPKVTANVGDVVRFTNKDLAPHPATADNSGWDTGEIARGESVQIVVTADMDRNYFCAFHPHMKGVIEIV
jgi:plastocyanin